MIKKILNLTLLIALSSTLCINTSCAQDVETTPTVRDQQFEKLMNPDSPYYFDIDKDVKYMELGNGLIYQLKNNGDLWGWGSPAVFLGGDKLMRYTEPGCFESTLPIKIMTNVIAVSTTENDYRGVTTFVIKDDHSLWGWGNNEVGQLGIGNTINQLEPVKVMENVKQVTIDSGSVLAVKLDGTLLEWGIGLREQYKGLYSTKPNTLMKNIIWIDQCDMSAVAIKSDHSLWGWGNNVSGSLSEKGRGGILTKPIKIADKVKKAVLTSVSMSYLKQDGTLYGSGLNEYGQLGANTNYPKPTTGPVRTMAGVADVFAGYGPVFALKKDGTLWSWGYNSSDMYGVVGGVLGIGYNKLYTHVPQKILSDVKTMDCSNVGAAIIKNDGSIWMTGNNIYGEIFVMHDVEDMYNGRIAYQPFKLSYDQYKIKFDEQVVPFK